MYKIILVAMLLLVPVSQAQQEVAFVHGINSDPSTWSDTRSYIGNRFAVSTKAPGYISDQPISSITANQVRSQISNGSILVGHSMGGLIGRQLRRTDSSMVNGLITVGTPHLGSGIAANADQVLDFFVGPGGELSRMTAPFDITTAGVFGPLVQAIPPQALGPAVDFLLDVANSGLVTKLRTEQQPTTDLIPSSPFLSSLNGTQSSIPTGRTYAIYTGEDLFALARLGESAAVGGLDRHAGDAMYALAFSYLWAEVNGAILSIYYQWRAYEALYNGCSRYEIMCSMGGTFGGGGMGMGSYTDYLFFSSLSAQFAELSGRFAMATYDLVTMDERWNARILQQVTGSECDRGYFTIGGDAIVPCPSQFSVPFMSADRRRRGDDPNRDEDGANHLEQTKHVGVRSEIDRAIFELGVARR